MIMKRLRISLVLALLGGALFAPPAEAARIELKNGFNINECWILEESQHEITIAVIRRGNIGKMVLSTDEVKRVDRTTEVTLEEALSKARKLLEEEQRKLAEKAAAAAATRTAQSGDAATAAGGAQSGGGAEGGQIKPSTLAELVGPLTPEEEKKIEELIRGIGDTRNQGGAGGRREKALQELVQFGAKALDLIAAALGDEVSYRRMNAARAVGDIAARDNRLKLYENIVPKLLNLLRDNQVWVRVAADRALQGVSGQSVGFPEPKGEELSAEEQAAIEKWSAWWEQAKGALQFQ